MTHRQSCSIRVWIPGFVRGLRQSIPCFFLGERQAEQVHAKMLGVADGRVIIWYCLLVLGVKPQSVWLECRRGTLSVLIGVPFFHSLSFADESLASLGSLIDLLCSCDALFAFRVDATIMTYLCTNPQDRDPALLEAVHDQRLLEGDGKCSSNSVVVFNSFQ